MIRTVFHINPQIHGQLIENEKHLLLREGSIQIFVRPK